MQRQDEIAAERRDADVADRELVRMSLEGRSDALDTLLRRHQPTPDCAKDGDDAGIHEIPGYPGR